MPVLPAGLAAAFLPQRPRPRRRLAQPLTRGRPGGFRGFCLSRASSSASLLQRQCLRWPGPPARAECRPAL